MPDHYQDCCAGQTDCRGQYEIPTFPREMPPDGFMPSSLIPFHRVDLVWNLQCDHSFITFPHGPMTVIVKAKSQQSEPSVGRPDQNL